MQRAPAQNLPTPAEPVTPARGRGAAYFGTERLKANLGARAARGGAVTVASQGFKFVAGLAATAVLARLLTPGDYGLVGMVAVVTGFVSLFKDLGLSAATVQREEVTADQVSTLFWVNVGVSVCVGLLTAAAAPLVARFYGEPRLTAVTLAYSGGFLLGGLTVQHEALLKRQMRFGALAGAELAALVASIAATVVLALRGAGYWALVGGHLSLSFVYMALVWGACRWLPGLPVRDSGVRAMLGFGGNFTGFSVVNYFARNLDNMLIGRFWGTQALGLYAKAYQLLLLPLDQVSYPVTTVAVPALSRLNGEPERYRRAYLRILEKIALVTMPGIALMVATADWIVLIVLGPQWAGAARIFTLLGVAAIVQPSANTIGWLFITQGRTRQMFKWGLVGCSIVMLSIVAGLPWGATGVAATYALTNVLVVIPLLLSYVGREGPVRARDFYKAVAPAALAAVCTLAALLAFRRWGGVERPVVGVAVASVVALAAALAALCALPAGRRALLDFKSLYRMLRNRGDEAA